jgi:DNA-binding NarL/FixJ family response regulator
MTPPDTSDPISLPDSSNPIQVFVLNDNLVFVEAVKHFLNDESDIHVMGTAAGLPEALAAAEAKRPDVVLIDPEPHDRLIGQAIRELRAALPGAGIIVLTLHEDEPFRELSMAAGADAFVGKWAASEDLIGAIRATVESKSRSGH